MRNLKNVDWYDVLLRAIKTFFEAFVGTVSVISVSGIEEVGFKTFIIGTLTAGVSAGISALWNMVQNMIDKRLEE